MGKSQSAKECKRHPNHNLLPGICPSCLREKLQQFHQSSTYSDSQSTYSSSSSSSLPHSSDFFFSADSSRHRRTASVLVTRSTEPDLFGDKFDKSGSIGILPDGSGGRGREKKKVGFWSRLLVRPKALYFYSQPKFSSREI